jgi:hypothetical protein
MEDQGKQKVKSPRSSQKYLQEDEADNHPD